jgi:hypothetical protein
MYTFDCVMYRPENIYLSGLLVVTENVVAVAIVQYKNTQQ